MRTTDESQRDMQCWDVLAALLEYPGSDFILQVEECLTTLPDTCQKAAGELDIFYQTVKDKPLWELQELYIAAYELNPVCALEVGWHLYGEDYKRGEFLAQMRRILREHGIPESSELPDHLSHVLRLIGVMNPADVSSFTNERLSPALKKMVAAFDGSANPFSHIVKAVQALIDRAVPARQIHSSSMNATQV